MEWRRPLKDFNDAAKVTRRARHLHRQLTVQPDGSLEHGSKEITLRDIQAGINGIYIRDTKKAELFSHLLATFKEDSIKIFLVFHFILPIQTCQRLAVIRYKVF